PDRGTEAEGAVIGLRQGLLRGVEFQDTGDGAEDFLSRYAHVLRYVGKDRGTHVETPVERWIIRAVSTQEETGAFPDTGCDVGFHPVPLLSACHGPDHGAV